MGKGGHYPSPLLKTCPNFQRVWASTTEDFFHFIRSALSCAWQWSAVYTLQKLGASFFGTRTTQKKLTDPWLHGAKELLPTSIHTVTYFLQIIKCDQNSWSLKNSSKDFCRQNFPSKQKGTLHSWKNPIPGPSTHRRSQNSQFQDLPLPEDPNFVKVLSTS